jgi:hypothetical protein
MFRGLDLVQRGLVSILLLPAALRRFDAVDDELSA